MCHAVQLTPQQCSIITKLSKFKGLKKSCNWFYLLKFSLDVFVEQKLLDHLEGCFSSSVLQFFNSMMQPAPGNLSLVPKNPWNT